MKKNFLKTSFAKTIASATLGIVFSGLVFNACSAPEAEKGFNSKREISVISREQGSGTRDAFVELTGVLVKSEGKKQDMTSQDALIIDGTQAVMSNVAGNEYAIGYISLGSLNNTVKTVSIEGVAVSVASVRDGSYKVARPFNVAYKVKDNELLNDFLAFIGSSEGADIIEKNGYVPVESPTNYEPKKLKGKLVIAGSSSVSPVMERLKEWYCTLNPEVIIEIQTNDSSSGMLAAKDGSCDLGMASRGLKESESKVLTSKTIAMDGIAIIANNKNPVKNLSLLQVKAIFTGEAKSWEAFVE